MGLARSKRNEFTMNNLYMEPESSLFDLSEFEIIPEQSSGSATCKSGMMAEMIFAVEAAKRGFCVFFPIGHSQKADLIIWKPPSRPVSIQIKKATYQKDSGAYKFMIGSGKPSCAANPNDYGKRYTMYQKGDFDVLCAYVEERQDFLFYALSDIAGISSKRWHPASGMSANNWDLLEL